MAPEPFDSEKHANILWILPLCLSTQRKPIKEVIMDGHVISGCGNIYATEALYRMSMHPARTTERISLKRKTAAIQNDCGNFAGKHRRGGSSISDYRNINGESGSMQDRLQMYGRKVCPACGTETESMKIGGRTSVYCPKCQKSEKDEHKNDHRINRKHRLGKSTVSKMLKEKGFPIVDADEVARFVVEPGTETLQQIANVFGEEIIKEGGTLNRENLGKLIFGDVKERKKLNNIIHPAIRVEMIRQRDEWIQKGANTIVMDIPTPF